MYSDLSEILEYLDGGRRSDAEVADLFLEVEQDEAGHVRRVISGDSGESIAAHREILANLYSFLSIILRLSMLHDVYIAPRKASELAPFYFHHVMQCILQLSLPMPHWEVVRHVLQGLPAFQAGQNGRSLYYRDLYRQFHAVAADDLTEALRQAYPLAEAVVDLCYNYGKR